MGEKVTLKNVIRVFAIILEIVCFVPTFLVSCSGEQINVSVLKLLQGIDVEGTTITEANPVCIIYFLMPLILLLVWFLKGKIKEKIIEVVALIAAGIDFIAWFVLKGNVANYVEKNYCTMKITGWFYLNQIILFIILLLSVVIVMGLVDSEKSILMIGNSDKPDGNVEAKERSGIVVQRLQTEQDIEDE